MHRTRFETAGWAAFDRKQREKQGSGPIISNETYSGLMESPNKAHSGESSVLSQSVPTRSFSSVVQPSMPVEFPFLKAHTKLGTSNINIDGDQHVVSVKSNANPVGMLKHVHSWADQHLIEDILAAVNNDVGQASILLKEMVSSETETKNEQPGPFGMCSVMSNLCEVTDIFLEKASTFVENNLSDNSHKELIIKQFYVPTEPDWEEDDVYLSHRKEALKMMRAASQHSRAANNAYLRGDHLTAQKLSLRAREEWMTAEQLNAQAAEEILRIRNSNNDIWKLDLHGLHATEAVHALKQHLQRIESKMVLNPSASPDELAKLETIQRSPSFVSLSGLETSSNAKGNIVRQQRQTLLYVITGTKDLFELRGDNAQGPSDLGRRKLVALIAIYGMIWLTGFSAKRKSKSCTGNHSKGQASLPAAIKSFLIDGGYRFDDARPGVISVRPMFRYK